MLTERSIWFFIAISTAVECSAASPRWPPQDHADEHLRESQRRRGRGNGPHERLAHQRDAGGRRREDEHARPDRPGAGVRVAGIVADLAGVEVAMRLQREDQAGNVEREEHDRDLEAHLVLSRRLGAAHDGMDDRGDHQADRRERE
jgi:hypothetical protein